LFFDPRFSILDARFLDMTSIQFLKGVGPKKAELFGRLGIETLEDLLFYFPRAWEDRRLAAKKDPLPFLDPAPVIKGRIKAIRDLYTSSRLRIFKTVLETPSGEAEASFFKRHSPRFDVFAPLRKDLILEPMLGPDLPLETVADRVALLDACAAATRYCGRRTTYSQIISMPRISAARSTTSC